MNSTLEMYYDSVSEKKPKVFFQHFGCRLNRSETGVMAQSGDGEFETVHDESAADFIVINTCTVTNRADQKNRSAIRRARKNNPNAFIVVTGCYATTDAETLESMDEVGAVMGTSEKFRIPSLIRGQVSTEKPPTDLIYFPQTKQSPQYSARSYMKIQEGCDYRCSYCKIPYARGKAISREIESTLGEANRLIETGFHEIILTGVNMGQYQPPGEGSEKTGLLGLVRQVMRVKGNFLLRLSSLEPQNYSPELLTAMPRGDDPFAQLIKGKKLARFLHLPVQSGSNRILEGMNRKYRQEDFLKIVASVRKDVPEIHLGTDMIVGFPGETEECFEETLAMVEACQFANIHLFPFSLRSGVAIERRLKDPSSDLQEVGKETKKKRIQKLTELKEKFAKEYVEKTAGKTFLGIVENPGTDVPLELVTENYVKLTVPSPDAAIQKQKLQRAQLVALQYNPDKSIAWLESLD